MSYFIRAYEETDYQQVVDISGTLFFNRMGFSLVAWLNNKRFLRCFVAEIRDTNTIVGYTIIGWQDSINRKVRLELTVYPKYEQLGVRASLYDRMTKEIPEINPVAIQTRVFGEHICSLTFFEQRDFHENHRMVHASLSLLISTQADT